MDLVFATHNRNKVSEIQALMPKGIVIKTLEDIGCMEDIAETADTLQGNAELKARYVVDKYGVDCFSDDSGLEVEALDMRPGVHSARYAGDKKDDEANMQKMLKELDGVSNRKAQFRTVISLIIDGKASQFEGIVKGTIRNEKAGTAGFGYDPLFEPEDCGITFAEMSQQDKNKRSHRARAFEKMVHFLNENN